MNSAQRADSIRVPALGAVQHKARTGRLGNGKAGASLPAVLKSPTGEPRVPASVVNFLFPARRGSAAGLRRPVFSISSATPRESSKPR